MSARGQEHRIGAVRNISALPPRADVGADIVEPPVSATSRLLDHLVGALLEEPRHVEAERPCGLEIDDQRSNFVGCSTGISAGFPPCKILTTNAAARRNESGPSAP
jgi:hypothetical protein